MFKRDHHIKIATVLQALNSELLKSHHCYFGGGTAIVLAHKEYRESADIDFLISDPDGYRAIRTLIKNRNGIQAIVRVGTEFTSVRDARIDQYGIRSMLQVAETEIKFEIVFEARIKLETPSKDDQICGVTTLSQLDSVASKLLANSDRWTDDSVFSRDLIDLAMLQPSPSLLRSAVEKAEIAYGGSITVDLDKAIKRLGERRGRLDECMDALKISELPKAVLWKQIRRLRSRK